MSGNQASQHSLQRVFHHSFSVRDIAEPLASFDGCVPASEVRDFLQRRDFDVVGIRKDGLVVGLVHRDQLDAGCCGDYLQPIDPATVLPDSTPLANVVAGLKDRTCFLVSILGHPSGIVTRSDLQKPPVRMWLFGIITLTEMRLTQLIERFCPAGSWRQFVSDSRLQKAEELLAERKRRNQNLDLLDCLQFADKGQIVARNEELRRKTRFESRRKLEQTIKSLEQLRNNLAHSQDILASDWELIVLLSENLDLVLEGPPGLAEPRTAAVDNRP